MLSKRKEETVQMKITLEMPSVSKCGATQCGYNVGQLCHAKAITIGDEQNPGCDTFFGARDRSNDVKRVAGVGACKVSQCLHNSDYECTAKDIEVGITKDRVNCLTYHARKA